MMSLHKFRPHLLAAAAAVALVGAPLAFAQAGGPTGQQPSPQAQQQQPQHGGMGGMMGGGMMGGDMSEMMRSCHSMMGSGMGSMGGAGAMGMPKFPPGNEKLEAQMHAEMMQKMGEIAARYSERIQGSK